MTWGGQDGFALRQMLPITGDMTLISAGSKSGSSEAAVASGCRPLRATSVVAPGRAAIGSARPVMRLSRDGDDGASTACKPRIWNGIMSYGSGPLTTFPQLSSRCSSFQCSSPGSNSTPTQAVVVGWSPAPRSEVRPHTRRLGRRTRSRQGLEGVGLVVSCMITRLQNDEDRILPPER